MRAKNACLSGQILLEKAKDFAKVLNIEFQPSNGWLERWKKRNNIHFKKAHGEKVSADAAGATDWMENVWPEYRQEYDEDHIYNADESALFYKVLPSGSLAERTEKISGGKLQKDRVTLLFITNATGSHKKIYMIGKSKSPRCFKNYTLPIKYYANSKAWMTNLIWNEIMIDFNNELKRCKKKALMLVDNAACHFISKDIQLDYLNIKYLPPNTTSIIQPLDQGIIHSFKSHYRQMIARKLILYIESGFTQKSFPKQLIYAKLLQWF